MRKVPSLGPTTKEAVDRLDPGEREAVGTPIGLEVLDVSDVRQDNLQFEVDVNRPNDGEGPTGAK